MALRGDELFLSYGVMGGFMQVSAAASQLRLQVARSLIAPARSRTRAHACVPRPLSQPQGHVQVLLNMLRGYSAQAALDAPRFCISAGSPETQSNASGEAGDVNSEVYFEEGIADDVVEKLRGTCVGLVGC